MSELAEFLDEHGFQRQDKGVMRKRKQLVVLPPDPNRPWVTLQKLRGSRVDWFVDFPKDAPESAVAAFILTLIASEN